MFKLSVTLQLKHQLSSFISECFNTHYYHTAIKCLSLFTSREDILSIAGRYSENLKCGYINSSTIII